MIVFHLARGQGGIYLNDQTCSHKTPIMVACLLQLFSLGKLRTEECVELGIALRPMNSRQGAREAAMLMSPIFQHWDTVAATVPHGQQLAACLGKCHRPGVVLPQAFFEALQDDEQWRRGLPLLPHGVVEVTENVDVEMEPRLPWAQLFAEDYPTADDTWQAEYDHQGGPAWLQLQAAPIVRPIVLLQRPPPPPPAPAEASSGSSSSSNGATPQHQAAAAAAIGVETSFYPAAPPPQGPARRRVPSLPWGQPQGRLSLTRIQETEGESPASASDSDEEEGPVPGPPPGPRPPLQAASPPPWSAVEEQQQQQQQPPQSVLPEQQQQPPLSVQHEQQQHGQPPPDSEDLQDEQHRQRQEPPVSVPQQREAASPPAPWPTPGPSEHPDVAQQTDEEDELVTHSVLLQETLQSVQGVAKGLAEQSRLLNEREREVNAREAKQAQEQFEQLCHSMSTGDTAGFEERLQTCIPATLQATAEDKATLLHKALNSRNYDAARRLLQSYPGMVLKRMGYGWTPLMVLIHKRPGAQWPQQAWLQMLDDYIAALQRGSQEQDNLLESLGWVDCRQKTAYHMLADAEAAEALEKLLVALQYAHQHSFVNAEVVLKIRCKNNQTCSDIALKKNMRSCQRQLMELGAARQESAQGHRTPAPPGQVPKTAEQEEEERTRNPWAAWKGSRPGSNTPASSWSSACQWHAGWAAGSWESQPWDGGHRWQW